MVVSRARSCIDCGSRLASDNVSQRCGACARDAVTAASSPPDAPSELWNGVLIQAAIAGRNFGKLLRAYRTAFVPALTQADIANWLDLSQAQVSRIESGRTPVNDLTKLTLWSQKLKIPSELLWFQGSNSAGQTLSLNVNPATLDGATDEDGDDVRRREFLKTAVLSAVATATDQRLSSVYVPQQRVGIDEVAVVRETTATFRNLDNRFGGGHGRIVVSTYLAAEVAPTLSNDNFARGIRKEYQRAAVELHQLAGWMAYDVGDNTAGRSHLREALDLANEAGDDALVAEMLAAISHQAAFHRSIDEAIDMALAARRAAVRSGAPALHAEAAVLEAHGLALQGNGRGCIAALQRAEKAFGAVTVGNTPGWLSYFDEAYLSAKFAHALRDLGRPTDAERFARGSLKMSEGYERGRLFNTALLSSILIDQGRVDEGTSHAIDAVQMSGHLRSARAHGYLRDIGTRLRKYPDHNHVPAIHRELASLGV